MLKDKIRVTVEPCKIGTRGGLQVFFLLLYSIAEKEPHCYDSLIWINLLEPPFYCLIEVDVVWSCWIKLKSQLFLYSYQRSQNLGMSGQRRFYCIISTILLCCARVSFRGVVAQWEARLIRYRWMPVSREFEPHQRLPLFPWAWNFTLTA